MASSRDSEGTIVTFYSYKGGVGRSFILANVAVLLASWGHRVLVCDWDLEAPGLTSYLGRSADPRATRVDPTAPGIVDLAEQMARGNRQPDWLGMCQGVNV